MTLFGINSIFLCQFNQHLGFRVIDAYPNESISTEQLAPYSVLLLPQEQMCNRLLAIQFQSKDILLGMALVSSNKSTYARAKYIYSLNIVVGKKCYIENMKAYKLAAKKLARFVNFIQQSTNTLYNNNIQPHKTYLSQLLKQIYIELKQQRMAVISHLSSNYTVVNLEPIGTVNSKKQFQNRRLNPFEVPITSLSYEQIEEIQSETARKLMKYAFEGTSTIKKISEEVKKDEVEKFYLKAMEYGLVKMVDLLSFNNIYALTEKIHDYMPNGCRHSDLKQISKAISLNKEKPLGFNQLLLFYLSISRKTTLLQIIQGKYWILAKIDVIKWIRISQLLGIIIRVYQRIAISAETVPKNFINQEILTEFYSENKFIIKPKGRDQLETIFESSCSDEATLDQICVSMNIPRYALRKILGKQWQSIQIFNVTEI